MRVKQNMFSIFIALLMVVIAGCSSSTGDARTSGISGTFNGGDRALIMEFGDGTPPLKVRDQGLQPFTVRFLIENVGEYDIEQNQAHVALTGFSSEDLNLDDPSQPLQALRGVKQQGGNVIDGGRTQVTYSNLRYLPELPSGTHTQTLYANLCYPYKTKAVASLCISGDTLVNYDEQSSICDLESQREFANSGSPLRIENVNQYPAGQSSIEFQFDIVHTPTPDNGRVYRSESLDESCDVNGASASSVDAAIDQDYVQFSVSAAPLQDISCNGGSSTGEIQLNSENRATVFCSIDTTGEEEYVKPVTIELDYDYLERISTDLQIEHVSR